MLKTILDYNYCYKLNVQLTYEKILVVNKRINTIC